MTVAYLRTLATRCLAAARESFDVRAIEEFRKLAAEFTPMADELERANAPMVTTKRDSAERKDAGIRRS
jgi:hypothetical protein